MKFGLRLIAYLGTSRELIQLAKLAEDAGFDSVWFPHDTLSVGQHLQVPVEESHHQLCSVYFDLRVLKAVGLAGIEHALERNSFDLQFPEQKGAVIQQHVVICHAMNKKRVVYDLLI